MPDTPRALVFRSAGTNCDAEMVRAFNMAGAQTELVHLDHACAHPETLDGVDLIGFPGGFSYGDDIASGRIFAMRVRERLYPALRAAAQRGVAMIGACNGFQVMVQAGLLPGPEAGAAWPDEPPTPVIGLAENAQARFIDRWVSVETVKGTDCVWTRGWAETPEPCRVLPIAHGEGRLVATDATVARLQAQGHIALRYAEDVNGSVDRIAGLCDASGRIFGLMPHPERYLDWNRHPFFSALDPAHTKADPPGLAMFQAAVDAVRHEPV